MPSALDALRANTRQAVLTTFGIVIGVAAVIAIVALGQGTAASVTSDISPLGTNVITVMPGSFRSGGIEGGAGTMTSLRIGDVDTIVRAPATSSALGWPTHARACAERHREVRQSV